MNRTRIFKEIEKILLKDEYRDCVCAELIEELERLFIKYKNSYEVIDERMNKRSEFMTGLHGNGLSKF